MSQASAAETAASHVESAPVAADRGRRREYIVVLVALVVLTALEIGVINVRGIGHGPAIVALISLALAKAVLIAFFFMHLKDETRILRLTVFGPLAAPAIYALVLMADAAWRFLK